MPLTRPTRTEGRAGQKPPPAGRRPAAGNGRADERWHLARTEAEQSLSEFEFSLERLVQAFYRWKGECLAASGGGGLGGGDTAILNVIRMRERPKSLSEIARLLNRDDISNIQYAVRKLMHEGLVDRTDGTSRKGATYRVTAKGLAITERYAELRAEILMNLLRVLGDSRDRFHDAGHFLDVMAGMYDQSARQASTRRY